MQKLIIVYATLITFLVTTVSIQSIMALPLQDFNEEADSLQIQFQKELSEATGDSMKIFTTYFEYGKHLNEEGKLDQTIEQFKLALQIVRNLKNHEKVADVANWLANTYAYTGDFKASNETYKIALASAEEIGDGGEIAKISMNLAANYNFSGDYEKAIKYGLYALKTKETTNNLERICYHYIAMGNIFRENNNTIKWEEYVQKAYKMKEVEGCASIVDKAKIYNSLGGIAVQKEELEKGLLYYDTLMDLSKEGEYNQGINTALTNSAGIYKQLNNFPKALELATEAEKYFDDNPYNRIFNNNFKAELYQLMGEEKIGLELARKNVETEEIIYYSTEHLKCLQLLYELNFSTGHYNQAFFWNDSLRNAESILRDEDIRQSIEDLETKYETEKKMQQIELLTAENKLKKQRINVGIGLVAVLLIIIFLIVYILNIRKRQAELAQNNLQQQVLRAQMNPHFIFNVLGSIQNFMLGNDSKKAAGYLSKFASLTRSTLEYSSEDSIALSDEIAMLRNYMELEQMRKPGRFKFEIKFDEELELDFIQIPPMLIQPFIENAIKHGFKNINKNGILTLTILDKNDWIEFIIEDNGEGIQGKDNTVKKHHSMAMIIFEKRRKLIQQKYNKDFGFELQNIRDVDPDKSGVRIRIDVPVIEN